MEIAVPQIDTLLIKRLRMDSDKKKQINATQSFAFRRIEKMHPIRMLLYLSMIGIGVLFFILTVAFARTGGFSGEQFQLPKFFSVSAILLLFSSYTMSKVPGLARKIYACFRHLIPTDQLRSYEQYT